MQLILKIKNNSVELVLTRANVALDTLKWAENNTLSRFLLPEIDQMLKRNKIGLDKISGYKIISDVPKKWTSYRIADITMKSLIMAVDKPQLNPRCARSAFGGIQRGELAKKNRL